jgi:hypothetical protein
MKAEPVFLSRVSWNDLSQANSNPAVRVLRVHLCC